MFHPTFARMRSLQAGPLKTPLPLHSARRRREGWHVRPVRNGRPVLWPSMQKVEWASGRQGVSAKLLEEERVWTKGRCPLLASRYAGQEAVAALGLGACRATHLPTLSGVELQRPDRLRVIMPGDGPLSEFY